MGGELERAGSVERMITLDTGAVASLVLRDGPQHASAVRALAEAREPVVVPLPILAEIDRALSELASGDAMAALLDGIQRGDTLLDCGDLDLPRIRQLMTAYRDLGLAGAAVVACAERNGGTILSLRDALRTVARDVPITVLP